MKDHLEQLIAHGSTITLVKLDGYVLLLAAADLQSDGLWFYPAFGESQSHFIEADKFERDGTYINLYKEGRLLATIAPIETSEEREGWAQWQALLATPRGKEISDIIQHLKETSK